MSDDSKPLSGVSWEEAAEAFAEFGRRLQEATEKWIVDFTTAWNSRPRGYWEIMALRHANARFARRHHRHVLGSGVAAAHARLEPSEVRRRRRKPSMG